MKLRFSVIVPVYKVESYLRSCLDSILQQTVNDPQSADYAPDCWECISVDDGSPDNCGRILDEYAARDPRFVVIHQPNGGVSAARNAALAVARGEWVQFVDGDDSLAADCLARIQEKLRAHPHADTIEHVARYTWWDGRVFVGSANENQLPPAVVITGQDVLLDPFGRKYTALARCVWNKAFRRSVIEKAGLRFAVGIPVGEDSLFACQYYAVCGQVVVCPDVVAYLRVLRRGSALTTVSPASLAPQLKRDEVLYAFWRQHRSPGLTVQLAANLVALAFLGKKKTYPRSIRLGCIEHLLASDFYSRQGIPFLILHGTVKARAFALVYWLLPKALRRRLLMRM